MSDVVLGIDLGTSSMKGVAVDGGGTLLGRAYAEYPMSRPHRGWSENDPGLWWTALVRVVRGLVSRLADGAGCIRALSIVAQRDPFVLLDGEGHPVAPAISWTDQRTSAELAELEERVGRTRLIEITGGRPVVGGGLVNLMWTREHDPTAWRITRRITSPKDYLLTRLGAPRVTDATTPTRSLAFDVAGRRWSDEILDAVAIDSGLLDPVGVDAVECIGRLSADVAEELGLVKGVVLAAGCADDHAATIGSGALDPGQVSVGTGTCSSWRRVGHEYTPDLDGRVDCSSHAVPGRFILEATVDSVGSTLRWFRDEFMAGASYEEILRTAQTIPLGAEGAWCLPFVDGAQRAPWFIPHATAGFLGLTSRHTIAHLARAVIESVAYLYVPTCELMGVDDDGPLTIVDGEASSDVWNQIKADVLGRPVRTPQVLDAAAMGAALLGAVASGLHPDLAAAVAAMVRFRESVQPDPARHAAYAVRVARFTEICSALLVPTDDREPLEGCV